MTTQPMTVAEFAQELTAQKDREAAMSEIWATVQECERDADDPWVSLWKRDLQAIRDANPIQPSTEVEAPKVCPSCGGSQGGQR